MSWLDPAPFVRRLAAPALALAFAGLLAGCFQPMYGEHSAFGGASVKARLAGVQVEPIDAPTGSPVARLGVEVRNALIFDLTGGAEPAVPTHQLKIALSGSRQQVISDINTARPDVENYAIDATYTLVELATKRTVITGRTFSRVSYDIPGQQQRFARVRGQRDAEDRASKVIAEQVKQRLASYFLAGT